MYKEDHEAPPAASLLEARNLDSSVISKSNLGAKYMAYNLKGFYLATPMDKPEYMKIPITFILTDIITRYTSSMILKPHLIKSISKSKKVCMV